MKKKSYKYGHIFYYGLLVGAAIGMLIMSYYIICNNTSL